MINTFFVVYLMMWSKKHILIWLGGDQVDRLLV